MYSVLARLLEPLHVMMAALSYVMGVGIARYLGSEINGRSLILGLLFAALAAASMGLVAAVFRPLADPISEGETREQRRMLRNAALYVSLATIAIMAFIAIIMFQEGLVSGELAVSLTLAVVAIVAYAVPPVRATDKGFGEVLLALQVAYLASSMGFLLQARSQHALLYVCATFLTVLLLSVLVVLEFPTFALDSKFSRGTMLMRMGWQSAIRVHQFLIIGAFVILAVATAVRFPFRLLAPGFLTIPFAVLQVLLLRRLAAGAKPLWGLMRANAIALFSLSAYFLALSFWLG